MESIRWMEYINTNFMNGKIKHAYNGVEKKVGNYSFDGNAELNMIEINDDGGEKREIRQEMFVDYRGCVFHPCPHCRRILLKKVSTDKGLTRLDVEMQEEARIREIVDILRKRDKLENWGKPLIGIGPQNFVHSIRIKYECQWLKEKAVLQIRKPHKLTSHQYPFIFKDLVHVDEFTDLLRSRLPRQTHNGTPAGQGERRFLALQWWNSPQIWTLSTLILIFRRFSTRPSPTPPTVLATWAS